MRGVWIMASVAFREAARKRLLWMAFLAGAAFLALFGTGLHFILKDFATRDGPPAVERQVLGQVTLIGLYVVNLLSVMMTVLTSVDAVSGEISSGTIQAVAAKPLRRSQLFLGKWLGLAAMLSVYVALMVCGTAGVAYVLGGASVRHLATGLALIWLESMLLLTVTLSFGTVFSTLTSGVVALGLHGVAFMGSWIEIAGVASNSPRAVTLGIVASLVMPSESLWRRAAYEMQSPLAAAALGMSPWGSLSTPSGKMVVYAGVYLALFMAAGLHRFRRRDL
jgi:Cu-processing system permease protein